jgi:hypothetical protein
MELLTALDLVVCSSDSDIKHCSTSIDVSTLQQAIERLQRLIRKLESRRSHRPHKPLSEPRRELVTTLLKTGANVEKIFSQNYETVVGHPPAERANYWLLDIQMAGRSKEKTQELLRRVLAERSLANDFIQWNQNRLETIRNNRSFDLPFNRIGSIRSFVKEYLPGDLYENIARMAIKKGLRILAMECAFPELRSGLSASWGLRMTA